MRPIDELLADARHAADNGVRYLLINRAELRMLKDYGLVTGTPDSDVALLVAPAIPADFHFQLHVMDVLP